MRTVNAWACAVLVSGALALSVGGVVANLQVELMSRVAVALRAAGR